MQFFLVLLFAITVEAKFPIDSSHEVFLPPTLKTSLGNYKNFSVFWWNFVILEAPHFETELSEFETICSKLKTHKGFRSVECNQSLQDYEPFIKDWVYDTKRREPMPSRAEFENAFHRAMAQASLPIGPEIIQLLRLDPFESWKDLREIASQNLELQIPRSHGFLYEPTSKRVLIPLQMAFPPTETISTRLAKTFLEEVTPTKQVTLIGPHWSTLKNETQIFKDVRLVSVVGTVILILFILFLILCRRSKAVLAIPPVFIGMFASVGITIWVFGSIHGLTLAFGTAIIGLAIDYGLHGAFSKHHDKTWKSNAVGMFTTLAGLLIMMTSSIPLIRQLMFFSCVGLVLAFGLLYLISVAWPNLIKAEPFSFRPHPHKAKTFAVLALVFFAAVSPILLKPDFDMRGFDFQDENTKSVTQWLFKDIKSPLFEIYPEGTAVQSAFAKKDWGIQNRLKSETLANYTVPIEEQIKNSETWANCSKIKKSFSLDQQQFFAPFFEMCNSHDMDLKRSYNAHLTDGSSWITLWFPKHDQQNILQQQFPHATSIAGIVSTFPMTLLNELRYMIPLSILLASALLYWYYRRLILTGFALIPFLTGVGLLSIVHIFFQMDISFITLIGLVMVFGFSIDYGIFVTDATLVDKTATDVWTAISFAALTNLAGFAPLLVCEHPVLKHLGQALFFGTIGTYVGAIWGITGLERYAKKNN